MRRSAESARRCARLALALGLALLEQVSVARAQDQAPRVDPAPPLLVGDEDALGRAGLSVHQRIGEGMAPFYTTAFPTASARDGEAATTVIAGRVQLEPELWIGVRVPVVATRVEQPAGVRLDEAAWGNPELYGEHQRVFGPPDRLHLRSIARLALGLPLAEHGTASSLMENRALAIADALAGWGERELYTPGVLPVTASGRVDVVLSPWVFSAGAKLPILVRVSDADLPEETTKRALGFAPLVEARATVWPWRSFGASLGGHVVIDALAAAEAPRRVGSGGIVQPVLEPRLLVPIHSHFLLVADFVVPLGGPLGGGTNLAFGLHLLAHL